MNYNLDAVNDLLLLSAADDHLSAGSYTNALVAGLEGNDSFQTVATGGTFAGSAFSGGAGNDRLIIKSNDTVVGHNIYNGGAGTDSLELASDTQVVMTAGDLGTTVAIGTTGSILASGVERFVVYGSELSDTLIGSAGNDFLDGRGGVDTYQGSAGNDAYTFDSSDEFVAGADLGTDTIWTTASINLNKSAGVENLRLKGDLAIDGTGNALNNLITGSTGANVIAGGLGNDQLWGKGGADTFAFSEMGTTNRDSIFDFDANDVIKLDKTVFANLTTGDGGALAAADFVIGTKATADHAQVIYNKATGFLSYDADGIGGAAAQDIALIGKNLAFMDNAHVLVG